MSCLFEFCGLFAKRIMWSIISNSISLLVCQDSGPHMSARPLRDEIISGVATCPESSRCSCVSLTPSSCIGVIPTSGKESMKESIKSHWKSQWKVIERVNVNTHCKSGQYKLIMCHCINFISFFSSRIHLWFLYRFGISISEY